jgi:hypothetical protein
VDKVILIQVRQALEQGIDEKTKASGQKFFKETIKLLKNPQIFI